MLTLGYVNFFISDFDQSLTFFRDKVGLSVLTQDEQFGYASFDTGVAQIAMARVDPAVQPELLGRHTGIGLVAKDIHAAFETMQAKGVSFEQPPTRQPWGGILALFTDPDQNIFYLDEQP